MFKYFENPEKYSYLEKSSTTCCICNEEKSILYSIATDDFECCCNECLLEGKLIEAGTWINDCDPNNYDSNVITYQTPPLPTWQDLNWPIVDGTFCVFIKLASKVDFDNNIEKFRSAALPIEVDLSQIEELWEALPNKKITSLQDGNYDTSFYLFRHNESYYWIWDAS
ncbi:MAG: hypothetical protein COB02_01295 [Candidatus Cloacimonadota bacterium]|nr:MAG: hypothetical protein COB02_01295 [Candidatus Cloacimonadota bacterium]